MPAPDPRLAAFRQKLRRDLGEAGQQLSLARWRRGALASGTLATLLALALAWSLGRPAPAAPAGGLADYLADHEITLGDDRAFVEAYYAGQGEATRVRAIVEERIVAVREFELSDGRQMVVYTEVGDGTGSRSAMPVDDRIAQLTQATSYTSNTF